MALETTKTLVSFMYAQSAANAGKEAGVISFAQDTRQIFVGDGSNAVPFAGNVKNATFANNKLTITLNNGDDIKLDFSTVASTEGVMAVFTTLNDAISAESTARAQLAEKIDGAIRDEATARTTADASIRADFEAADTSILNKIGNVAADKTLVEMIQDAEAAAVAAGTIVAEDSDFITIEQSGDEGKTQTFTIKTDNIAKASDLVLTDSSLATEISERKAAIAALDSSFTDSDASNFVSVHVEQIDGKVTTVEVSTADIASAEELANVKATAEAARTEDEVDAQIDAKIATLKADSHTHANNAELDKIADGDKEKWDAATTAINNFLTGTGTADVVDTLKDIQDWMNGDGVDATELTKAIADEADLRKKADASIRTDFGAADAQIRTDFAAADASVLNSAKDYADEKATAAKNAVSASGDNYVTASAINGAISVSLKDNTIASLGKADSALQKDDIATGSANGTIAVDGADVAVKGLGSAAFEASTAFDVSGAAADASAKAYASAKDYADGLASNYASAAQGAKADSAVQSVTTGTANGTITVDGKSVAVAGLGSAAYANTTDFDASGLAASKAAEALNSAKSYSDEKSVNGITGNAITITGADIAVGGSDSHASQKLDAVIEHLYDEVATAKASGVQSFTVTNDSSSFAGVTPTAGTGAVKFSVKIKAVEHATAEDDGLAKASDVKAYVDESISNAALKWTVVA